MSNLKKVPAVRDDGLQLEVHSTFQSRFWRVERFAWGIFALLVLAGLLGFLGSGGPFSHAATEDGAGRIEHPRVARWQAADEMVIEFGPGAAERQVRFSSSFADYFQIENVQPDAQETSAGPDGHVFTFGATEGQPARIVFHLRPQHPGLARYDITLDGGTPQPVTSLILP